MSDNKTFFVTNHDEKTFGTFTEKDDFLHPQMNALITTDEATETQYFGFSVPEENIHAVIYLWHHVNLGTVSGGVMVWQGIKPQPLAAEIFDWRHHMSDRVLRNDLHSFEFVNGYKVDVIEPLNKIRARYDDDSRGNSFDITLSAVVDPVMLASNAHFEQAMRARGQLTLRGKSYSVDCYNVRDRSWGESRGEQLLPIPPVTWMTAVFDENFIFSCNITDHPDKNPIWRNAFDVNPDSVVKHGWIYKDGDFLHVIKAEKLTHYRRDTLIPTRCEMVLIDEQDNRYEIEGEVIASCNCNLWANMSAPVALVKWTCGDKVAYGDFMDAQWGDFVSRFTEYE